MNVTGDPIDERGPIQATVRAPIHADPPAFTEQATSAEILVTGIKVVDLIAPYSRGGKTGLFVRYLLSICKRCMLTLS